jgi:hypothetical protein
MGASGFEPHNVSVLANRLVQLHGLKADNQNSSLLTCLQGVRGGWQASILGWFGASAVDGDGDNITVNDVSNFLIKVI